VYNQGPRCQLGILIFGFLGNFTVNSYSRSRILIDQSKPKQYYVYEFYYRLLIPNLIQFCQEIWEMKHNHLRRGSIKEEDNQLVIRYFQFTYTASSLASHDSCSLSCLGHGFTPAFVVIPKIFVRLGRTGKT
jgi:hypothetical protein